MIYKIRIVSDEIDNFRRDINIDSEATFEELKDAICDSIGFDGSQMSSFFICDDDWGKNQEITLEDMGADVTKDLYLMKETRLEDLIDDVGQKMLFTFDYLNDRSLFLQVKDAIFGEELTSPECVLSKGNAPQQHLPMEDVQTLITSIKQGDSNYDLDEDFLGSDDYDIEEIEGLDEMDF